MNSAQNWLVKDHSQYEEHLAKCQNAIETGDWDKASSIFEELVTKLKLHMVQEEDVVYPIYDALVKINRDPTRALRTDHERIISFLKDMRQVIKSHDSKHGIECLNQLEELIARHHEKEEDIFLPMAGYVLSKGQEEVTGRAGPSSVVENSRKWEI